MINVSNVERKLVLTHHVFRTLVRDNDMHGTKHIETHVNLGNLVFPMRTSVVSRIFFADNTNELHKSYTSLLTNAHFLMNEVMKRLEENFVSEYKVSLSCVSTDHSSWMFHTGRHVRKVQIMI